MNNKTSIRTLSVQFDLPMRGKQISQFRAAIAEAAGFENDLFHNHRPDGSKLQRYPLIQYRVRHGTAALFAINEGIEAVQQWLFRSKGQLRIGGETLPLPLVKLDACEHALEIVEKPRSYYLNRWLPFNREKYGQWLKAHDLEARVPLLNNLLVSHLLTFCRAANWDLRQDAGPVTHPLDARLQQIVHLRQVRYHGVPMVAFEVVFSCNLALPFGIGLGRAVSSGFGVSSPVRSRQLVPGSQNGNVLEVNALD